jgi:putative endonuclease
MWYVYVLLSLKDKKFYTGYTEDLKQRLQEHTLGRVSSTKNRRPLKLIYYEASPGQRDALQRERYLKTTWGKRYLRNRLKSRLESMEG